MPKFTPLDHETARIIATVPHAVEHLRQMNTNIERALDALEELKGSPRPAPKNMTPGQISHPRVCSAARTLARVCGVSAVLIDELLSHTPDGDQVKELKLCIEGIFNNLSLTHHALAQLELDAERHGYCAIPEEFLGGPKAKFISNAYLRAVNPAWKERGVRDPLMVPTCWVGIAAYDRPCYPVVDYTRKRKRADVEDVEDGEGERDG
ncbi:uncharacterized protein B0H18DRAFT_1018264 [Fomitopsis serialis]|uniref:uncharacterized protein n=1 Tax=Fomitopsis serialis TaxID=139415 RepID=UPI002007EAA1|nr:uncharacterized protein B0H18DRAFT_1018264 [Neoantrodia serialis]KAH9922413.1 hypothetical protein B0H18DRAFT_1018264 [Neoantrodia serialis]